MSSSKDIQRALNAIRSELDDANQQTRLEVLQLMLASSESIVAAARKLDKANGQKKHKATSKPRSNKPAWLKPTQARQQSIKRPVNPSDPQPVQSNSPIKPLPAQPPQ